MESLATVIVVAHIMGVVALFNGMLTCFAQAKIVTASIEAIARQPAASGKFRPAFRKARLDSPRLIKS